MGKHIKELVNVPCAHGEDQIPRAGLPADEFRSFGKGGGENGAGNPIGQAFGGDMVYIGLPGGIDLYKRQISVSTAMSA